jgi:hypothetical protein
MADYVFICPIHGELAAEAGNTCPRCERLRNPPPHEASLEDFQKYGINPLAVELLTETFSSHPDYTPVTFRFRGVSITMSIPGKSPAPEAPTSTKNMAQSSFTQVAGCAAATSR